MYFVSCNGYNQIFSNYQQFNLHIVGVFSSFFLAKISTFHLSADYFHCVLIFGVEALKKTTTNFAIKYNANEMKNEFLTLGSREKKVCARPSETKYSKSRSPSECNSTRAIFLFFSQTATF